MAIKQVDQNKPIKGFKAFNLDNNMLHCRGYFYAPGKIHNFGVRPKLCKKGFHFCEKIIDVFNYYNSHYGRNRDQYGRLPIRIAKVSAWGHVDHSKHKSAASCLRVDKVLTLEEVLKALKHDKEQTIVTNVVWDKACNWDFRRSCWKGTTRFLALPETLKRSNTNCLKNIKLKDFKGKDKMKVKVTFVKNYFVKNRFISNPLPKIIKIEPIYT